MSFIWIIFFEINGNPVVFPFHTASDTDYSTFIAYHSSIFKNMFNFISQTSV